MITILFPGSFKPMHGGHVNLIERYLNLDNIKEIKVLVGSGIRDEITQDLALIIAKKLISNDNITIELAEYFTPILTAYKFIESAPPGVYAMGSVKKDTDYNRVINFVNGHSIGGKYYDLKPKGVEVVELSIDLEPLRYIGRTDNFKEEYISASILRQDILNNDFENFKTNYPNHSISVIEEIWNLIK